MAKDNKNTTTYTFTDERVLGSLPEFAKARAHLNNWLDEMAKKTLTEAFSGGKDGMPFSALNLGIISTIGQGGIRARWIKACTEKGKDNVNIGDFIVSNLVQETAEEREAREAREAREKAVNAAADAWERSIEAVLDTLPDVDFINGKKVKITHNSDGEPIENGEEIFAVLVKRAEARAEAEKAENA
jgi:hypothetical protein